MAGSQQNVIYELIGRVSVTWNTVEDTWYLILTTLMHETPRATVDAVFRRFQTGAAQREMIIAVASAVWPTPDGRPHGRLRAKMGELYERTGQLAGRRNAVVHSLYIPDAEEVGGLRAPEEDTRGRPHRLAGKPLLSALGTLHLELVGHAGELNAMRLYLAHDWVPSQKRRDPHPYVVPPPTPPAALQILRFQPTIDSSAQDHRGEPRRSPRPPRSSPE